MSRLGQVRLRRPFDRSRTGLVIDNHARRGCRMACRRDDISHSSQTRSSKPFTTAGRSYVAASFTTATAAHDTRRSRTLSGSPRLGSSRRSARSATPCLPKPNANIIVSQTTRIWRGDLAQTAIASQHRANLPRYQFEVCGVVIPPLKEGGEALPLIAQPLGCDLAPVPLRRQYSAQGFQQRRQRLHESVGRVDDIKACAVIDAGLIAIV